MAELDKARALERIKKCLALSESANPHEAELALRQARKLMDKFHLDYSDVAASRAQEREVHLGSSKRTPMSWVRMLADTVGRAMGCVTFTRSGLCGQAIIFIGETGNSDLAAYVYEVLARQLEQHRKKYVAGLAGLTRGKKRVLGTRFAEGWIAAVSERVDIFAGVSEEAEKAIKAYCEQNYPNVAVAPLKVKKFTIAELYALKEGIELGETVSLHRAMPGSEQAKLAMIK